MPGEEQSPCDSSDQVSLPLDALLHVFQWLSTRDLLRGPRGVSRSWRGAALEPALWRDRRYSNAFPEPASSAKALLALAPCLSHLALKMGRLDAEAALLAAVTPCAASQLHLNGVLARSEDVTAALRRQVELGKLRSLQLVLGSSGAVLDCLADARLEELDIHVDAFCAPLQAPSSLSEVPPPSALKWLKYCSGSAGTGSILEPLLEHLLQTHAATLEVVVIGRGPVSVRAVELLSRCVALQEADLPAGDMALAALQDCPRLVALTLYDFQTPAGLEPYFRSAAARRLERLHFKYGSRSVSGCAVELLKALGSAGSVSEPALLRELRLDEMSEVGALDALPAALAGLPLLRALHLRNVPPRQVLDAVTPYSAPALRLLDLGMGLGLQTLCGTLGSECYLLALQELVKRNRQLHLLSIPVHHSSPCHPAFEEEFDASCACCRSFLHFRGADVTFRHFYGHMPFLRCDLEEHDDGENWWWVGKYPDD